MRTLPSEYLALVEAFAPVFSKRIWNLIQIPLVGAIPTPNQRLAGTLASVIARLHHGFGESTAVLF